MNEVFVTVGTHEQPFDRLFREIDDLLDEHGRLDGRDVFCQYGYSTYHPRCAGSELLPAGEVDQRIAAAPLVISHGGPGSIMPALRFGVPLVLVPRQREFGEHVDDHQVAFCRHVGMQYGLSVVEDMSDLPEAVHEALRAGRRDQEAGMGSAEAIERLSGLIAARVHGSS